MNSDNDNSKTITNKRGYDSDDSKNKETKSTNQEEDIYEILRLTQTMKHLLDSYSNLFAIEPMHTKQFMLMEMARLLSTVTGCDAQAYKEKQQSKRTKK